MAVCSLHSAQTKSGHGATSCRTWAAYRAESANPRVSNASRCSAEARNPTTVPRAAAAPTATSVSKPAPARKCTPRAWLPLRGCGPCISFVEPLRDWKAPPDAKRLGGDLQPGSGLLAFVFVAIDLVNNISNQCNGKMKRFGDRLGRFIVLNIVLENAIQHVVPGQGICVFLIRPQLRRWRLGEDALGNRIGMTPVRHPRKVVD